MSILPLPCLGMAALEEITIAHGVSQPIGQTDLYLFLKTVPGGNSETFLVKAGVCMSVVCPTCVCYKCLCVLHSENARAG